MTILILPYTCYATTPTINIPNDKKAVSIPQKLNYQVIDDPEKHGFEESIYSIVVNKESKSETEIILIKNNVPYVPIDEIKTWRLQQLPTCFAIRNDERDYYRLDCLTGVTYKLDQENLLLDITFPVQYFVNTDVGEIKKVAVLASPPKTPGGFLNYDLDVEHLSFAESQPSNSNKYNGLFELGYFNFLGVGQTNFLLQHNTDPSFIGKNLVRLYTTWTHDDVDNMYRLQFGDIQTNNNPGNSNFNIFSRSMLIGGVHFAKNYSLQPETQIYPMPQISRGAAVVPSTIDYYLNNVRMFSKDIPPGPFDIHTLPVITGAGTIQVVTHDIFGNEQIINLPYYYTTELLKKGLHQYSLDAGFTRQNFGVNSFDYNNFLIIGTERYGLNDKITLDAFSAVQTNHLYMLSGGVDFLPNPKLGVVTLGLGGSLRRNGSSGLVFSAGFNTQKKDWNFGVTTRWLTKYFLDLGYAADSFLPKQQSTINFSRRVGRESSLGLSLISQSDRSSAGSSNILAANFTTKIFKSCNATVLAQNNLNQKDDLRVMLYLTWTIFNNNLLSLSGNAAKNGGTGHIGISKNLTDANGWGYNFYGEAQRYSGTDIQKEYGRLSYQSDIGTYHGEIAKDNSQISYRLNALGGVLLFDGSTYLSRSNTDSFGIVETPGYKNVRVYRNTVLIGRTDNNGKIVIPKLMSYYTSNLEIDADDIPLDTKIDGPASQAVVPYYSSAVKTVFQIKKVYSIEFKLTNQKGIVIPQDAIVKQEGGDEEYYVDEDGKVFIELLGTTAKLKAIGSDGECDFTVNIPENAKPEDDYIYQLGTIGCVFKPYPQENAEVLPELQKKENDKLNPPQPLVTEATTPQTPSLSQSQSAETTNSLPKIGEEEPPKQVTSILSQPQSAETTASFPQSEEAKLIKQVISILSPSQSSGTTTSICRTEEARLDTPAAATLPQSQSSETATSICRTEEAKLDTPAAATLSQSQSSETKTSLPQTEEAKLIRQVITILSQHKSSETAISLSQTEEAKSSMQATSTNMVKK